MSLESLRAKASEAERAAEALRTENAVLAGAASRADAAMAALASKDRELAALQAQLEGASQNIYRCAGRPAAYMPRR